MAVRTAHLSVALLFAAPLAIAPLRAQGVAYAAGTNKYRVTANVKGTQTSMMGNAEFQVGVQEQITVNLMKHAKDTVMATMTLDSIAFQSSAGQSPDVSKMMGVHFVTLMSPTGTFYFSKAPDGIDPSLASITDGIGRLLPAFRGNVANGVTWTDTTSGKVSVQGMDMDRTTVSNYNVRGDTTIGAEKAFRIQRITTSKAAGSGSLNGAQVTIETSGTSTGAFFLTPKGVYLGGTSTDDANTKITVLAQNLEIGVKQSVQTKVEAIK
jgi:hypothetical protein